MDARLQGQQRNAARPQRLGQRLERRRGHDEIADADGAQDKGFTLAGIREDFGHTRKMRANAVNLKRLGEI